MTVDLTPEMETMGFQGEVTEEHDPYFRPMPLRAQGGMSQGAADTRRRMELALSERRRAIAQRRASTASGTAKAAGSKGRRRSASRSPARRSSTTTPTRRPSTPAESRDGPPEPPHARSPLGLAYQNGGHLEAQFKSLLRRERKIAKRLAKLDLAALRKDVHRSPMLSGNAKTSESFDVAIGHSCDPTHVCAQVCFGSRPGAPAAWDKSLRKRLRNLRYLQRASTDEVVDRLTREFRRKQRRWAKKGIVLDFLRFNGIGDLIPQSVAVINAFAVRNPDVLAWVVSRKFHLASQIVELPNVFVELSLDSSTPPHLVEQAYDLVRTHSRTYLAFLRTKPNDDTLKAAIVYNEKRTKGLPYNRVTDCPVDAGALDLGNERGVGGTACAKCRKCFGERTLERQRQMLGLPEAKVDGRRRLPLADGDS
jgi:hypothetical protein